MLNVEKMLLAFWANDGVECKTDNHNKGAEVVEKERRKHGAKAKASPADAVFSKN